MLRNLIAGALRSRMAAPPSRRGYGSRGGGYGATSRRGYGGGYGRRADPRAEIGMQVGRALFQALSRRR